jgi:hypothetical protein
VERAFHELKSTFEIRPIWLSREDQMRGDFAVCFLAFCLQVAFRRIVHKDEMRSDLSFSATLLEFCEARWSISNRATQNIGPLGLLFTVASMSSSDAANLPGRKGNL